MSVSFNDLILQLLLEINCLKIVIASQPDILRFKDNWTANIYCNQECLRHKLTPNYTNKMFPSTSAASKFINRKTDRIRVEDDIRCLGIKKQQLHIELYHSHPKQLKTANTWGKNWDNI
jgi:hypothetical protein